MTEDKTKDHIYSTAQPPNNVRCRKCLGKDLKTISKDLWHKNEGKDKRVLFMFKCNSCGTNTAYFDDGEEWIVEPTRCPECKTEKVTYTKTDKDEALTIKYTCQRCDHVWEDVHDYSIKPEEEKLDPNYEEDRKLFCYSKKVREWAEGLKNDPIHYTRPSWEESETEKLYKAELEKIEMQTVTQVDKRLSKILTKNGYKDFTLGKPDLDKELQVLFTAIDNQDGRTGADSKRIVWKIVNKELENTNWRLVRSSLDYKVGYVKGKLKAYENKYELEKLIDIKLKRIKRSQTL